MTVYVLQCEIEDEDDDSTVQTWGVFASLQFAKLRAAQIDGVAEPYRWRQIADTLWDNYGQWSIEAFEVEGETATSRQTFDELDVVQIAADIPALGLSAGTRGTVVMVYGGHEAYEVEFVGQDGDTIALEQFTPDQLLPVTGES